MDQTPKQLMDTLPAEPEPQLKQPSKSNRSHSSSSSSHSNSSSRSQSVPREIIIPEVQVKRQIDPEPQKKLQNRIRYKYCCKICKHTDKSKKACVCVVPKNQRRTQIGGQGCQTCGCDGCSKQDFVSRGQDPEYKPGQKTTKRQTRKDSYKQSRQFQSRNGCCRNCMKAFSKSNKSCLCQVPQDVRNTKLPCSGCKICGCFGCNPEDKKDPKNRRSTKLFYSASKKMNSRSRSRDKNRQKRHRKSISSRSSSSDKQKDDYMDPVVMNFYNVDKSVLGSMMVNQFRIDPALIGFGIPQRTFNYIVGKPK